jgi:hypothetical protein
MGTNFYFIEPAPRCPHCDKPIGEPSEGQHIGKRSAAGLYCYDCDDTLVKAGKARIHYSSSSASGSHDACPKCGAKPPDFSVLQRGSTAVELGMARPEEERPKGVFTAASFSWAAEPEGEEGVRAVCERNLEAEIIVDEYGRLMTGAAFLKMLRANCPIEYRHVGENFS